MTGIRPKYSCIFCSNPDPSMNKCPLGRIREVKFEVAGYGGFGVKLEPHPKGKFHYSCDGCDISYKDVTYFGTTRILHKLKAKDKVKEQVDRLTNRTQSVEQLIQSTRGIGKKPKCFPNFPGASRSKIYVHVMWNHIPYVVSLASKGRHDNAHYLAENIMRVMA